MKPIHQLLKLTMRATLFCTISIAMIASGSRPPAGAVCKNCVNGKNANPDPTDRMPDASPMFDDGTIKCPANYNVVATAKSGYACGDYFLLGTRDEAAAILRHSPDNVYIHLGALETLGIAPLPWNFLSGLTLNMNGATKTSRPFERIDWRLPSTSNGKTSFTRARSGFHYIRIKEDASGQIQPQMLVATLSYGAAAYKHNSSIPVSVFQSFADLTFEAAPDDTASDSSSAIFGVTDDRLLVSEDLAQQRGISTSASNQVFSMFAIQFSSPIAAAEKELPALIRVRSSEKELVTGWVMGPDKKTLFGAVEGDFEALEIVFGAGLKAADGRALDMNESPDFSSYGLTFTSERE